MSGEIERIGKYSIVKRLSVGGMAEVFLALARGPGEFKKLVTLKRIHPKYRDDAEFVTMFLDEARISASLSHANIAQVFDLGRDGGELFLTMEFVPGADVSSIIRASIERGVLPPHGFVAMIMKQALSALHYAHTFVDATGTPAPVVHRDVTPRNVMVTYAGSVKVIDFGIAKAMGSVSVTAHGGVKGSRGYMSPEQLRGALVDARSDIFSVGVLLHELLVGERLFPTPPPGEVTDFTRVTPPSTLLPSVPQALSDVAMKALSVDTAARFQTAREMMQALDRATAGAMFDEDQAGAFMRDLFKDNLERTRALVQSAGAKGNEEMRAAAAAFPAEAGTGDGPMGLADFDAPTALLNVPAHISQEAAQRRPLVIAVDDSPAALQVLQLHMGRQGIDVVACSTPTEAIEAIKASPPDAIVLDVVMPELDGFTLCKKIREIEGARHVPIVFLSAFCDLGERVKCLDAGGDDFVRKPYAPEELAARLRSHLVRAAMIAASSPKQLPTS